MDPMEESLELSRLSPRRADERVPVAAQHATRRRALLTVLVVAVALTGIFGQQLLNTLPRATALLLPPLPTPTTPTAVPAPNAAPAPPLADLLRRRALHLPALAAGAACPTTPQRTVNQDVGPSVGDGPMYALLDADGTVRYTPAQAFQSQEWGGQTVVWMASPRLSGLVLLRGQRLDGSDQVRFGSGNVPAEDRLFHAPIDAVHVGNTPWLTFIEYTRLRAPGCYAYQIDGAAFSTVIVFLAVPQVAS
jgi:hypothetical protein